MNPLGQSHRICLTLEDQTHLTRHLLKTLSQGYLSLFVFPDSRPSMASFEIQTNMASGTIDVPDLLKSAPGINFHVDVYDSDKDHKVLPTRFSITGVVEGKGIGIIESQLKTFFLIIKN